jgi:hypothetical protein
MLHSFESQSDEDQLAAFKQFFEGKFGIHIEDLRQFCDSGQNLLSLIQLCVPNESLALPKLFARGDQLKRREHESVVEIAKHHEIFTPDEAKSISPDDLDIRARRVSGLLVFLKAIARKAGFDFSPIVHTEQPDQTRTAVSSDPTQEQSQEIKELESKLTQNILTFAKLLSDHRKLLKDMENLMHFFENIPTADEIRNTPAALLSMAQSRAVQKMEEIVDVLSRVTQSNLGGTNTLYQMIVANDEKLTTLSEKLRFPRTVVSRVNDPSPILAKIADAKAKLETRLNSYITPFQQKIAELERKTTQLRGSLAATEALNEGQKTISDLLEEIERELRWMQSRSKFPSDQSPRNATCLNSLKSELENLRRQFVIVLEREKEKRAAEECIRSLEKKLESRHRFDSISAAVSYKQSLLDTRNQTLSGAEHAKQFLLRLKALCDGTESCEIVPDHEFTKLDIRVEAVMKRTDACFPEIEEEISRLVKEESASFEARFATTETEVGKLTVETVQSEFQLEQLKESLERFVASLQQLKAGSCSLFDSTLTARYQERLARMRDHLEDTHRAVCQRLAPIYWRNHSSTHRGWSKSEMIVKVQFSSDESRFFVLNDKIDVQSLKDICCRDFHNPSLCRAYCNGNLLTGDEFASSFGVIGGATIKVRKDYYT